MRQRTKTGLTAAVVLAAVYALGAVAPAQAANDCTLIASGQVLELQGPCVTDETIIVPDGKTLDGNGHAITAIDPSGDHFRGAVVANGGNDAHVTDVTVTADDLANACDGGDDRLRGILLEGASGSITRSRIIGINQGPSGCQEGNAIEVRNEPFDGSHPDIVKVEIAHNEVDAYQKTGIVANGDVDVDVHHNVVGISATQQNLAANGIQLGFGALGSVTHNRVKGSQWMGTSAWAATAVLLVEAGPAEVSQNNIRGNSGVALYIASDAATVVNNRVFDEGSDHPNASDFGVVVSGSDNDVRNNKVRGFDIPYWGVADGDNKAIPSPM